MEEAQLNFKMENNINWDELKRKVDADLQKDIDEETRIVNDIEYVFGRGKGIVNLKDSNNHFYTHLNPKNVNVDPFNLFGRKEDDEETEEDEEEIDYEDDDYLDENDDEDYNDEGGEIPQISQKDVEYDQRSIEQYAWNNKDNQRVTKEQSSRKKDIQCDHVANEFESYNGDVYIYPLSPGQDICLCKDCHRELASKIMEQLAMEMFL